MDSKIWPAMGCGVGLRNKHYTFITSQWPKMDWFEAVTENFMDTGGRPLAVLQEIRQHYPVALHGVSLSIGTTDSLDKRYLERLKTLIKRIEPFVVSDHLCWTGVDGENLHDLLPLPYTEEALDHVVRRIERVQETLGRPVLMENISTYVTYKHSVIPEWEFLRETARRSGCGILLDLNNIYVNSVNHRFDPMQYLHEIPGKWVGQFHLAGHTDKGAYLFDTHSAAVVKAVWELYKKALELYGPVSTLIEWDEAIPDFPRLTKEVEKAKKIYETSKNIKGSSTDGMASKKIIFRTSECVQSLKGTQLAMRQMVRGRQTQGSGDSLLNPQGGSSGQDRMAVYADGYLARLAEALEEIYEAVNHYLGKEAFIDLTEKYLDVYPSKSYNLNFVGKELPEFIKTTAYFVKLPFLPDLARLEWEVAQAFHAVDEKPFDRSALGVFSEEDWEKIKVFFQSSVRVIFSRWPIVDLWRERKTKLSKINILLEGRSQHALVYRQGLDVHCENISEAQGQLVNALKEGRPLGEACARLAEQRDEPPVGEWFSAWASQGLIARVG